MPRWVGDLSFWAGLLILLILAFETNWSHALTGVVLFASGIAIARRREAK